MCLSRPVVLLPAMPRVRLSERRKPESFQRTRSLTPTMSQGHEMFVDTFSKDDCDPPTALQRSRSREQQQPHKMKCAAPSCPTKFVQLQASTNSYGSGLQKQLIRKQETQKFSENSGMLIMYFRFNVQRRAIFKGSVNIRSIKFDITM